METMFNNNFKQLDRKLDEVLRLLKAKNRLDGKNILDTQDLCLMLNLSKRTLRRYRASGILPYIQIAGKPFYYYPNLYKNLTSCTNQLIIIANNIKR